MAKKDRFNYFDNFEALVDIASEMAEVLIEAIEEFKTAEDLTNLLERAHKIENRGDDINHAIKHAVAADFITPIERADILELAHDLDNITDMLEGVIQRFYMYNIHFMHPKATEFAHIIKKEIKALRKSMSTFREFKKMKKIRNMAEEVNELEEEADKLYMHTIRDLYTEKNTDPMMINIWSRLFDRLEESCDACEYVADAMADIMLKNA